MRGSDVIVGVNRGSPHLSVVQSQSSDRQQRRSFSYRATRLQQGFPASLPGTGPLIFFWSTFFFLVSSWSTLSSRSSLCLTSWFTSCFRPGCLFGEPAGPVPDVLPDFLPLSLVTLLVSLSVHEPECSVHSVSFTGPAHGFLLGQHPIYLRDS